MGAMSAAPPIGVIGVPSSAGAFAPGQENAPAALREAGLVELLAGAGRGVRDHGDSNLRRWRPDRSNPRAQNLETVVQVATETARRVADSVRAGEMTLVLGGDCTVGIGTVAGHVPRAKRLGLVYFDTHADLNVPGSVLPGALDWMGLAHMLGEDGATSELVGVAERKPLLDPGQVVLFAWGPDQATGHEREAIRRLSLPVLSVEDVRADPEAAAARARAQLAGRCDRLLVHFDVDVIDFTDVPLSENPGRNEGLAYEDAFDALRALLDPRAAAGSVPVSGLTVTELNPAHAEAVGGSVERFASDLAASLAAH
jgi:arginase